MESVIPYRPRIVPNDPVPSPFAWVPTLPTISQTREAAINSIQQNFAALNAGTAALPYLPLAGGVTMAGLFSLFANAATAMQAVPLQQLQSYVAANNGVATFNTRTGAVTLTSADVSAALTYVAANAAGQAFTGNISAPAVTSKAFNQTTFSLTTSGAFALDYNNGQSQVYTINAASSVSAINNVPVGSIFRVTFILLGVPGPTSWPANVKWVGATAPDLSAGALDRAVVVFENDGTYLLANSAAY
jgi:hypothetical protein